MTSSGPDDPDDSGEHRAPDADLEPGADPEPGADLESDAGVTSDPDDASHARYGGSGPRLNPALIATLVTIPVRVIVGFIVFAALRPEQTDSTPVESYAADSSTPAECPRFLAALPQTFEGYGDKEVSGTQATWRSTTEGDPVIVRCGVSRPSELSPTSNLQVVNPVQWFITDSIEGSGQAFVCVDHRPYVALWVPVNAGNGPITDVSATIERTLPRGPLDFG